MAYSTCACTNCPDGAAEQYKVQLTISPGPCDMIMPNSCANISGTYTLQQTGLADCERAGGVAANICGYTGLNLLLGSNYMFLELVSSDGQNGKWDKTFSASDPMDCLAGNTLNRTQNSVKCSMPATVTVSAVAPSLASMGDWESGCCVVPLKPGCGQGAMNRNFAAPHLGAPVWAGPPGVLKDGPGGGCGGGCGCAGQSCECGGACGCEDATPGRCGVGEFLPGLMMRLMTECNCKRPKGDSCECCACAGGGDGDEGTTPPPPAPPGGG